MGYFYHEEMEEQNYKKNPIWRVWANKSESDKCRCQVFIIGSANVYLKNCK